jgi:hypothetical protein
VVSSFQNLVCFQPSSQFKTVRLILIGLIALTSLIPSSIALEPFVGPRPLFQFRNPIHSRTPWKGDWPVARPLPTHRTTQTEQTHMHREGFERTTPLFERAKTVHALDSVATAIGRPNIT